MSIRLWADLRPIAIKNDLAHEADEQTSVDSTDRLAWRSEEGDQHSRARLKSSQTGGVYVRLVEARLSVEVSTMAHSQDGTRLLISVHPYCASLLVVVVIDLRA